MAVSSGPLDSFKRDWRQIGDSSKVGDCCLMGMYLTQSIVDHLLPMAFGKI